MKTEAANQDIASAAAYLAQVVTGLVMNKDAVRVEAIQDARGVLLTVHAHHDDHRYLIGKKGGMANAMRTVMHGYGAHLNCMISVKLYESPEREAAHRAGKAAIAATGASKDEPEPRTDITAGMDSQPKTRPSSEPPAKIRRRRSVTLRSKELEAVLDIEFADRMLLETALTHRSFLNENPGVMEHNERLEFLGDAVLEHCVTDFLYRKYENSPEGELTTWRSALVNGKNLCDIGERLGIFPFIRLSKGEAKACRNGSRARSFIIANALEAIIGAIYLDSGLGEAKLFIDAHILSDSRTVMNEACDWKGKVQEFAQEHFGFTPSYSSLSESGQDHDKSFKIALLLDNIRISVGEGNSKKEAQTRAASHAWDSQEEWGHLVTPKWKKH